MTRFDRRRIAEKVRQQLDAWQTALMKHGDRERQTLREILVGPLTLTPEGRAYRFEGEALHGALIACKVGLATFHESPWARHPFLE